MQGMNIFFDCDYTILDWNGGLRPGVRELFRRLTGDGHAVYVWSGVGIRWDEVKRHNLDPYVVACFHKPLFNYESRLEGLGITPRPDMVVDDYLDIVRALGGIRVRPYIHEQLADREMEKVYQILSSLSMDGHNVDDSQAPPAPESP